MARLTKENNLWSSFIEKTQEKKKAEQKAAEEAVKELKISEQKPGQSPGDDRSKEPYDKGWPPKPIPAKDRWQVNAGDGIPRNIDLSSNAPVWPADKWPHPTPGQGPLPNPTLPDKLAQQLQIDGTLIASGGGLAGLFGKKEIDIGQKHTRGTHINLINYANSEGTMGTLPEGWTLEEARRYRDSHYNGTLKPR